MNFLFGGVMIMTIISKAEGISIMEYNGILTGDVIIGANIFHDIFASVTAIVGGRSAA
jgi:uncharacterized protein YbjQ (UPF0145 family)